MAQISLLISFQLKMYAKICFILCINRLFYDPVLLFCLTIIVFLLSLFVNNVNNEQFLNIFTVVQCVFKNVTAEMTFFIVAKTTKVYDGEK